MRSRVLLAASILPFSFALLHCVADEPATITTSDDGGSVTNDGGSSTIDSGWAGDGATNDSGPTPTDACIGKTDCPTSVQGGALQLWLRGNVGVNCSGGRVAAWADQSGNGRDGTIVNVSTITSVRKALGPTCGTTKINGADVVTFDAPPVVDAGVDTQYKDGSLGVDMNWILDTEYTVMVVHRRAVDAVFGLLAQERSSLTNGCLAKSSTPQQAFQLGFEDLDDGGNALYLHQFCTSSTQGYGASNLVDDFAPAKVSVEEVVFTTGAGHQVYSNGVHVVTGTGLVADVNELDNTYGPDAGLPGSIGRGGDQTLDERYHGDIAEIIGWSAALSDADRATIEGYLKRQWGVTF